MSESQAHALQPTARIARTQAVWNWLRLATHPATVRRALFTAIIVGTVLITINHGDALLRGELSGVRITQMLLTLAVPYIVSTVSSVSTRRELGQKE
ncbi:nitrate/nitrite transporter NrtS [candidate division KSB1 bacterium]|nr:nitrate/nitrite transporter NrtS [candidate division KSB1 bacterium]